MIDDALLGALLGIDTSGNSPGGGAAMGWPLADIAGGLDEMVLGDSDLLGAALAAQTPQGKAALVNAIRQRKLQQSALVTPRSAAESNLQPLGFEFLGVAAGADATVNAQPQTLFKPQRLLIPATIAPFFTIKDIKVGNVSQFPSSSPIPGEAFVQGGFGVGLSLKTVNPAINLTLIVNNISGAVADFRAAFFGVSVQ